MKQYNEMYIEIILFSQDDIVKTSPGGVDFGSDDLGWGE